MMGYTYFSNTPSSDCHQFHSCKRVKFSFVVRIVAKRVTLKAIIVPLLRSLSLAFLSFQFADTIHFSAYLFVWCTLTLVTIVTASVTVIVLLL